MGNNNKGQKRKCFVITPIGDKNSDIFRKAKGVIESVVKPVLKKQGFEDVKPSYEITESGMIGNQIIERIMNDDLVIANLTGNNPNVMYELAIRHATAKPIIHICEIGTILPFDIKDNRTIFYADDMLGTRELEEGIEKFVKNIEYDKKYKNNPIYNSMNIMNLFDEMGSGGRKTEADILQKILNEISFLKTNIETKKYIKENIGIYEVSAKLFKTKEEIAEKIMDSFPDDISVVMAYDSENNEAYLDITAMTSYYQENFLSIIDEIIKKSEVCEYAFSEIRKIC